MLYFDEVILSLKLYRDKVADEKREPGVRVEYVVTRSETLLTVCVAPAFERYNRKRISTSSNKLCKANALTRCATRKRKMRAFNIVHSGESGSGVSKRKTDYLSMSKSTVAFSPF